MNKNFLIITHNKRTRSESHSTKRERSESHSTKRERSEAMRNPKIVSSTLVYSRVNSDAALCKEVQSVRFACAFSVSSLIESLTK